MENAFGILAQRWQILLSTMMQGPDIVREITETCICLHNLMRERFAMLQNGQVDAEDDQHNIIPGQWRATANMHEVDNVVGPNRDTIAAKKTERVLEIVLQHSGWVCTMARTYDHSPMKFKIKLEL